MKLRTLYRSVFPFDSLRPAIFGASLSLLLALPSQAQVQPRAQPDAGHRAPSQAHVQAFDTWIGHDTGSYPEAFFPEDMEMADLNQDGYQDAIVINRNVAALSVLRNKRGKGFARPVHYPTSTQMYGLEVIDIDLDGDLDVITSDSGSVWEGATVSVMRNDGEGNLLPQVPYAALVGPAGLVAADFDGDGLPDLVATSWDRSFGDEVALLRNDGAGGFLPAAAFTVASGPYDVAAGDLDGDGAPDLVVGRSGGFMSVMRNTGGSFSSPEHFTIHNIPLAGDFFPSVHVADADHDGDLDVFYTSSMTVMGTDTSYGAMVVLLNDGSGNLSTMERHPLVDILGGGSDSHLADLTGDGWLDVLTVHRSAGGWTYMHSDSQGGFFEGTEVPGGEGPVAIRAADANADGMQDVLVLSWESLEMTVHLNDGDGNFQVHHGQQMASLASDMDLADVDGDGDLDAATSGGYAGSGNVGVLLNDGTGRFSPPTEHGAGTAAMAVKLRDLDGDGWPDLLWADHPTSFPYDFWTARNDGSGNFEPPVEWSVNTCGNGDVDAFDMDGDGDLDVFLTEYLGCPSIYEARCWIRPNLGDGTFGPRYAYVVVLRPEKLDHGDLDLDGHQDLVLSDAGGVTIGFGRGDGTFDPPLQLPLSSGARDVAIEDVDEDGVPDVIASCSYGGPGAQVAIFLGNGDRTFRAPETYQGSYSSDLANARDLIVADADGDGRPDVMTLNGGSNDFSFFRNVRHGFREEIRFGLGPAAAAFAFADVTGDGIRDMAAVVGIPPYNLGREIVVVNGLRNGRSAR